MHRTWMALALAAVLPLSGCVFAVGGGDDEKEEALRDRVRDLERRVERMEDAPHSIMIIDSSKPLRRPMILDDRLDDPPPRPPDAPPPTPR